MKIVIDARELRSSTGRYVERLLHYLQQLDNMHSYVVLLKPGDVDTWHPSNPRFMKVTCKYKEFSFGEQLGFAWQLYRLKPDLVHFSMIHQPLLYFGKSVTTMHDLTTARFRNPSTSWLIFKIRQCVYKGVIVWAAHKSKRVFTPSECVKKDVAGFAHISPGKILSTHEAADPITHQAEKISILGDKKFIMYVGRPLPHKNLGRLIDAYEILQRNNSDLWLVLAGKKDALYKRHEKAVKERGLKNIIFMDFVSEGQLRWLYENTLAYIFPSLSEGFGLPGLEAMLYGAPVVSSNATCLPEIYGDAAQYFDPMNVQDMAQAIEKVLIDESLRRKLIKKGYEQIKKYSWRKMAAQTLEVYKKVLKN